MLDLDIQLANKIISKEYATYASAFSLAAVTWNIKKFDCCKGFLWAWCENQVNVAIKLVPLGQTAGQQLLSYLIEIIPEAINEAALLVDEDIGSTAVGLGIASANHESQYTRLFRS